MKMFLRKLIFIISEKYSFKFYLVPLQGQGETFTIANDIDDARSHDHLLLPYDLPPTIYKKGGNRFLCPGHKNEPCMRKPTVWVYNQV